MGREPIRNSLLILGCLTARFGQGKVPLPGGCKLGGRGYDIHKYLLEQMGARVYEEGGYLCTQVENFLFAEQIFICA